MKLMWKFNLVLLAVFAVGFLVTGLISYNVLQANAREEILDNARYAPTVGRDKVDLIDEVHMLSKAAFNSMLKTHEEPPSATAPPPAGAGPRAAVPAGPGRP